MVGAGELAADDGGYRLVGPLLDRSARQDLSAGAATRPWRTGDPWTMAVVVGDARRAAERTALRRAADSRPPGRAPRGGVAATGQPPAPGCTPPTPCSTPSAAG